MLNTAQWASLARVVVIVAGGIAVGRGWATQEQVTAAASDPAILAIVAGIIAILASGFYALKSRTTKALLRQTSDLPGVGAIIAKESLADAVPRDNVVSSVAAARDVLPTGMVR